MYAEKILGIIIARRKNAWKSSMYQGKCSETTMYAEKKCSESSIKSGKMLGIIDARGKNARNHRCTQKKCSKSPMKGVRMLGKDKVC